MNFENTNTLFFLLYGFVGAIHLKPSRDKNSSSRGNLEI